MSGESHLTRLFHRATREHLPLTVMFELTNRCNFRCQHCYLPSYDSPDELPTERIFAVFDELAALGTLYLGLTGGEVLLRRDWAAIVGRARALGFHVTMLTNGSLLTAADADLIADLDVVVHISFFSADATTFDRVTTKRDSFAKVIRAIETLLARQVTVELKVPLTTLNADGLREVAAVADRYGLRYSAYPRIHARTNGDRAPIQLRLPQRELESFYLTPQPGRAGAAELCSAKLVDEDTALCAAGSRLAVVHANGDVSACIIMPGVAGNLRTSSFRQIWETSPHFQRLRAIRWSDLETCSSCTKKAYCGRCPAQALLEDGSLLGPSHEACHHAEVIERAAQRGA